MKTANDYLSLDYPIELYPNKATGAFVARHPDLPGCITQGDSRDEALDSLENVRRHWIELRLERGLPVPVPVSEDFSGRLLLRMSPSLHSELAELAKRREVSLNLLINTALATYVGHQHAVNEASHQADRIIDAFRALAERATLTVGGVMKREGFDRYGLPAETTTFAVLTTTAPSEKVQGELSTALAEAYSA